MLNHKTLLVNSDMSSKSSYIARRAPHGCRRFAEIERYVALKNILASFRRREALVLYACTCILSSMSTFIERSYSKRCVPCRIDVLRFGTKSCIQLYLDVFGALARPQIAWSFLIISVKVLETAKQKLARNFKIRRST